MKKWNLLLVLALLFVACKDEYDVNLDELYGTTSGSSSKVDKEIITCGDSKVMIINIGKASMTTVPYEWEWDSKTADDLSATLKRRLLGIDECKVVNEGNDQLLLHSPVKVVFKCMTGTLPTKLSLQNIKKADMVSSGWKISNFYMH